MKVLNLGCGQKTSDNEGVTNIDWSVYLRIRRNFILNSLAPLFLKGERLQKLRSLPQNILTHNLANGIPFPSDSVDCVYHSHFLEHLDRDVAERFLIEVKRVLKPNGIHRIVVPDFEKVCRDYLSDLSASETDPHRQVFHEKYISAIIEQMIRKEGYGSARQGVFMRRIENLLLGDARARGETHRWMYDRISLSVLLSKLGYKNIVVQSFNTSMLPDWNDFGLDLDAYGNEYKPGSLYMEARC